MYISWDLTDEHDRATCQRHFDSPLLLAWTLCSSVVRSVFYTRLGLTAVDACGGARCRSGSGTSGTSTGSAGSSRMAGCVVGAGNERAAAPGSEEALGGDPAVLDRARVASGELVNLGANSVDGGAGERGRVVAEADEVGEEDGRDERRAPSQSADKDAGEDRELRVRDKVHRLVVVALDPELDLAADVVSPVSRRALLTGHSFAAMSALSRVRLEAVRPVKTHGENLGRMLVRRKVAQWKSEKVAKGRMVMLIGFEMSLWGVSAHSVHVGRVGVEASQLRPPARLEGSIYHPAWCCAGSWRVA